MLFAENIKKSRGALCLHPITIDEKHHDLVVLDRFRFRGFRHRTTFLTARLETQFGRNSSMAALSPGEIRLPVTKSTISPNFSPFRLTPGFGLMRWFK